MNRLLGKVFLNASILVMAIATVYGQAEPSKPSSPSVSRLNDESDQPAEEESGVSLDPASLLPDLPALPPAKATLVGGTIASIDRLQDRLTIRVFGGGTTTVLFDTRTHIYREGKPALISELKTGERAYVDTILADGKVFARNIRLHTVARGGESQGVVLSHRRDSGELVVRDQLSPEPLKLHLTRDSKITEADKTVSASELAAGALVVVKFAPDAKGHILAREVSIIAAPGASFTFVGKVTFLDLRAGLVVLNSSTDHKSYEIQIDPSLVSVDENLREGAEVTVLTRFSGNRYVASGMTIDSAPTQ